MTKQPNDLSSRSPGPEQFVMAAVAALGLALSAGCASAVKLSTDHNAYTSGQRVALELDNKSLRAVEYNLCVSTLQIETADGWSDVEMPRPGTCSSTLDELKVNRTDDYALHLPSTLEPGQYRFSTTVKSSGKTTEVHSVAFSLN